MDYLDPVSALIAFLIFGILWFSILGKMGYRGTNRWAMTAIMFFPLTTLIELIYLACFPWPVQKELKELRKLREQVKHYQSIEDLQVELDKLRGDLGMNQMKGKKNKGL